MVRVLGDRFAALSPSEEKYSTALDITKSGRRCVLAP